MTRLAVVITIVGVVFLAAGTALVATGQTTAGLITLLSGVANAIVGLFGIDVGEPPSSS